MRKVPRLDKTPQMIRMRVTNRKYDNTDISLN